VISSDVIRGYVDTIILSLLIEGDSYGYEISKNIRIKTDELYVIKETTLYSPSHVSKKTDISILLWGRNSGQKKNLLPDNSRGNQILQTKVRRMGTDQKGN